MKNQCRDKINTKWKKNTFLTLSDVPHKVPGFAVAFLKHLIIGMMVVMYRVVMMGWAREEAIQEMLEGGYGFHPIWGNLVRFICNMDLDAIREGAGIIDQIPGLFAPMPQINPTWRKILPN